MRVFVVILFIIFFLRLESKTQSRGNVLLMEDGTIRIPDNSITVSKISTLQALLDSKQPSLPSQVGQAGKVLYSNGTIFQWQDMKTVNNQSLIGSGNIDMQAAPGAPLTWGGISGTLTDQVDLATALNGKQNTLGFVPLATNGNGSALTGLSKSQVGLTNVDNTSDAAKPISTATQAALNNKSTYYVGIDAGANDSYVVTLSPAPSAYTQGMIVIFRANTVNTGACSINANSLGVRSLVKRVSTTPANGDIPAQAWVMCVFDGTNFVILNPVVN